MKVFIFLYPTAEYIDLFIGLDCDRSEPLPDSLRQYLIRQHNPRYINDLVRERYRKQDYQVVWLFQGTSSDNIELCQKSEFIEILADDIIAPSFSWEYHADAERVVAYLSDNLSEAIEKVELGGYHRFDCVERFAKSLYRLGMDVHVDEDLTDDFFLQMRYGGIPIVRTEPRRLVGWEKYSRPEDVKGKPWFNQT